MRESIISSGQIALACGVIAVLGVIILYIHSLSLQPKDVAISEALVTPAGQYIRISGVVESIELGTSFSKFIICEFQSPLDTSQCISVRLSNELLVKVGEIYEGDLVTAIGIMREYYNNKYIEIGDKESFAKAPI